MRQRSVENALETLRKYKTVFVIDDSKSMFGTYWKEVGRKDMSSFDAHFDVNRQARDALATLAEHAQKYDTDGIDVHFFNSKLTGPSLRVKLPSNTQY
jgi:hypothetical protein